MAVFAFLLVATALALLAPGEAFAWGPGVHTAAARFVLANLDLVPSGVAALIAQFPGTYLYGCLSADFFVGKGSRVRPGHSHNWESARRLFDAAHSPELQAHALGYASHLAADVVAHNYYVPGVMILSPLPGNLAHAYVEAQADSRLTGGHGLKGRLARPSQRVVDRSLVSALEKNTLSYHCRKQVFSSSVALAGLTSWNRSLRFAQRVMPLPDDKASLEAMFDLSLRAILDTLRDPEMSVLGRFDPIGSRSLALTRRQKARKIDSRLLGLPGLPAVTLLDVA